MLPIPDSLREFCRRLSGLGAIVLGALFATGASSLDVNRSWLVGVALFASGFVVILDDAVVQVVRLIRRAKRTPSEEH